MTLTILAIDLLRTPGAHFTHADVVTILGVSSSDLQNWANRKLITPDVDAPGKQGKRRYTFIGLVIIEIASKLIDLGVQASRAFKIATHGLGQVVRYIFDHAESDDEKKIVVLPELDIRQIFTAVRTGPDGKHIITTFIDTNIPIERLLGGPALTINTGELIIAVAAKLQIFLRQIDREPADLGPSDLAAEG